MPRPKKPAKMTRLNLELSESLRETLEQLQRDTDADSLAQVVRRAVAVYEFLWREKEQGAELFVSGPGRRGKREVVLL